MIMRAYVGVQLADFFLCVDVIDADESITVSIGHQRVLKGKTTNHHLCVFCQC